MTEWIDLTRPLTESTEIYRDGTYSDPEFHAVRWSDHEARGYEVWRLELGTQTGTHIDAPRHFDPEGATIESLRPDDCVGAYRLLRVDEAERCGEQDWAGVAALVLDARAPVAISAAAVEALGRCVPRLVVLLGEIAVSHPDPLYFHRHLAGCGKFLLEDTRCDVGQIPRQGRIVALPLGLVGLSGSPARVLLGTCHAAEQTLHHYVWRESPRAIPGDQSSRMERSNT